MTWYEAAMTILAVGWASVAVYFNGQRLRWKGRAERAEAQVARDARREMARTYRTTGRRVSGEPDRDW